MRRWTTFRCHCGQCEQLWGLESPYREVWTSDHYQSRAEARAEARRRNEVDAANRQAEIEYQREQRVADSLRSAFLARGRGRRGLGGR